MGLSRWVWMMGCCCERRASKIQKSKRKGEAEVNLQVDGLADRLRCLESQISSMHGRDVIGLQLTNHFTIQTRYLGIFTLESASWARLGSTSFSLLTPPQPIHTTQADSESTCA